MSEATPFTSEFGTRFLLSVDTEEEFDWGAGFTRDTHSIVSMPALARGQNFFAGAGVKPLYFIDYPVARNDRAVDAIGSAVAAGAAHVGAHLHPWVTPPFVEALSAINSYAGNLAPAIERSKLETVRDLIADRLGVTPIAYRAGRYGLGPNSLALLHELGFRCDSSVRSLFDYREDGGPDYTAASIHPRWVGDEGRILELPVTSVLTGAARWLGPALYRHAGRVPLVRSIMARTRLMQRIAISPEGTPADVACAAIDVAVGNGLRLVSISFHSPSLAPGHTPYVRDAADLDRFYSWFDQVFDHCARRGITPASLNDVLTDADRARARAQAPRHPLATRRNTPLRGALNRAGL